MRRIPTDTFPKELRDKYYFLDYLRLHRFGKQKGIWKKNRNMLVKEHEYSSDSTIRARKGYKSYIQRCMKSILDWMYKDFVIIKPRNRFSYEIGKRSGGPTEELNFSQENANEDKIKFILQRYLITGDYEDLVITYRDLVSQSPVLSFKNQEAGIIITLDNNRSFGYQAVKVLERVRVCQDAMIAAADDKDILFKELLIKGLEKTRTLRAGTRIQLFGTDNRPVQIFGTISRHIMQASSSGTNNTAEINYDDGGSNQIYRNQFMVVKNPENTISRSPLLDRVLGYANINFSNTSGINSDAIFRLSRAAVIRELVAESDMHSATELRRLEPTADMLSSIGAVHEEVDEDYEGGPTVDCETCGHPEDDCRCCGSCGTYPCECDPYNEGIDEEFEV